MNDFSDLSLNITKNISKVEKKNFGIFFTPNSIISLFIEEICKINESHFENVLEPSCGSCEFITYLDSKKICSNIDGIEYNNYIYNSIKNVKYKNINVNVYNENFLDYKTNKKYELIIGNPPYFLIPNKNIKDDYIKYTVGKVNIFCLFILHSLTMLKDDGILGFIIPSSFLNSSSYLKIRTHIIQNYCLNKIINYENKNNFIDTEQSTIGIIISNKKNRKSSYFININNNIYFTYNQKGVNNILVNYKTLTQMGLAVKTGTVVWNECKNILTSNGNDTLLVYNTNIKNNKLHIVQTFTNKQKQQYIKKKGLNYPVIAVNRGHGNTKYKLSYCIIDTDKEFLLENHINYIYSPIISMDRNKLLELYNIVIKSFENKKTKLFIEYFIGNGSLSKSELQNIFPIFI